VCLRGGGEEEVDYIDQKLFLIYEILINTRNFMHEFVGFSKIIAFGATTTKTNLL
jgi:hypothetical protein